jgi:putative addiction module component (TIGR02574 family)
MKQDAVELLKQALKLPPEARAALAGSLLDSLDEAMDDDAEQAWEVEVSKRLSEIREGRVKSVPWAEARRRVAGE